MSTTDENKTYVRKVLVITALPVMATNSVTSRLTVVSRAAK